MLTAMAAVIAGAATLVAVGDPLVATASAFVVSECVALAAMLLADARAAGPRGGRTVDPAVAGIAPEGP